MPSPSLFAPAYRCSWKIRCSTRRPHPGASPHRGGRRSDDGAGRGQSRVGAPTTAGRRLRQAGREVRRSHRPGGDGHPSHRHLRGDRRSGSGQGDASGLRPRAGDPGALPGIGDLPAQGVGALRAAGRLDHLVEVALPDAAAQREILELMRARTEKNAGRALFETLDYRTILPMMGGMSGADIKEILRRAVEAKVRQTVRDGSAPLVTTTDLLEAMEGYKRVRSVVEKIRYGQYL